jgi:hypothetical protein
MEMPSQNWLYLGKRIGIMMKSRSVDLYRMLKILVDTVFEDLVSDKSFIETCNFLRSHVIRLDQQYKEKASRQIHNTCQLSNRAKKYKIKRVSVSINQIQIQDSCSSYEYSVAVTSTKTVMVC